MRPRTLGGLLLLALGLAAVLALVGAIAVSKAYWGYWFSRPSLDSCIVEARRYGGVAFFETDDKAKRPLALVDEGDTSVSQELKHYLGDTYTSGHRRVLQALDTRGVLSTLPRKKLAELPPISELVQSTGALIPPDPGYEQWGSLYSGLALQAEDADGRQLLFIGLHGGQVSNDHYPIYELLFAAAPGTERFELLSRKQWFVDIAGIEGLEWYVMFPYFFVAALVLVLIGVAIIVASGGTQSVPRA
jgi:hypothetical protein